MANAEILGDQEKSKDLDQVTINLILIYNIIIQKPTLYDTIVTSHATSVIHPTAPIGKANIIADSAVADQFGALGKRLPPGSFSSKVQIADLHLNEKGFGEMEKPVFITKSQKKIENKNIPIVGNSQPISNTIEHAAQLDTKTIKQNLKALKNKKRDDKLNVLTKSKKILLKEANIVKKSILKETTNLLTAKS